MSNPGRLLPNMQARMQVQYAPPNQPGMPPVMINSIRMPSGASQQAYQVPVSPSNVFAFTANFPALHEKVRHMDAEQATIHVNRVLENRKRGQNLPARSRDPAGMMPQFSSGGPGNFHPMMNLDQNHPQFPMSQPPPLPLGRQQQLPVSQAGGPAFPGPGPTPQNPSTINPNVVNPRTPQQPGSNQPVTSAHSNQQQLRNPGSVQQPGSHQTHHFPNGPSPMVHQIPSVGNPATPSQQPVTMAGPVIDVNNPEYKKAYSKLLQLRHPTLLLLDKMKIDNHPGYYQTTKMLEFIDSKKIVAIDVIQKLINNIHIMLNRYDITHFAQQVGMEIRKGKTRFPKSVDPYAKFARERIGAPKKFYELAQLAEKKRAEQLYVKRKARWFAESNFKFGDPEYPYPSVVYDDVNMAARLKRLNDMYNNDHKTFFVEKHTPQKVKINLDTNYIVRLDRLVNLQKGKEANPGESKHQEYEILPDKQTLHYDEKGVLIQSMPSTSKDASFSDEGPPKKKKRKCMLNLPTGSASTFTRRPVQKQRRVFDVNFYCQSVFEVLNAHNETKLDCRFSCCVPYFIDSIQGKQINIPQPAAVELRRYRHRADKEFKPISDHANAWSVIVNPTKVDGNYPCPELRIILNRHYPAHSASFEVLQPNPLQDPIVDKFYACIDKKMEERRQCDISMHTITEIVSAFRFCVEYAYHQKDVVDFRDVVLKVID